MSKYLLCCNTMYVNRVESFLLVNIYLFSFFYQLRIIEEFWGIIN